MSFTEGNTFKAQLGSVLESLRNKVGSFIIFVWPDASSGPSATFAISKNDVSIDWKRLSCVKDANGVFIVPSKEDKDICLGLSDATNTDYTMFNVKVLG